MPEVMVIRIPEGESLTRHTLQEVGKVFLKALAREIKKDVGRRESPGDGIPATIEFIKSFTFKVEKDGITLLCSWPWITPILEGQKPFKMTWLTQQRGVNLVPFIKRGHVEFRTTPATIGEAWIHPGMARHTFIQRAFNTVAKNIAKIIAQEQSKELGEMVTKLFK